MLPPLMVGTQWLICAPKPLCNLKSSNEQNAIYKLGGKEGDMDWKVWCGARKKLHPELRFVTTDATGGRVKFVPSV